MQSSPAPSLRPSSSSVGVVFSLKEVAAHEWALGAYITALAAAALLRSGPSSFAVSLLGADLCIYLAFVFTARSALTAGTPLGTWARRTSVVFALVATFLQLDHVLPAVTSRTLDASILALDLRLFGVEPAIAWDRWVTPATTEWFSFFYFGYFFLIAIHVGVATLVVKNTQVQHELALLVTIVFGVGHLTYLLVPGFGPFRHLEGSFQHQLGGPVFWQCVQHAVGAGGTRTDIFPSLHTAVPTALTLFSLRHRKVGPYRVLAPLMVLVTPQIVLATMFLRWHWLLDVVAGLTLATVAFVVATRVATWETRRRATLGAAPVWS
ncbi:MAG: phosphatase PAP2 family protein [Polyangiaceae bacterium]|nr:phosphatase PAP2 family protein [Polyangiaceae bacterium]